MRIGRDLIHATRPYAVDSPVRSWWSLFSTASLLAASTLGALMTSPVAIRLACSVLSGLLLLRLFVIFHDQQHRAILARSRLAEFLMRLVGMLALSPSSIWKSSHDYHHRHNSKLRSAYIGSFPVMTKAEYLRSKTGARLRYLFMRHPLTILFGYVFVFMFGMCARPFFMKPLAHLDCLLALVLHGALAATLVQQSGLTSLCFVLVLPHFFASALGAYLFYAQHNFPGVSFFDRAGWTYPKAALESSSYLKTGPVMAWFTANIGYHHVHHLNARIPFFRLPKAMAEVDELATPKTTSLHPADVYRCLALKVWDVETQRMVSLRGG